MIHTCFFFVSSLELPPSSIRYDSTIKWNSYHINHKLSALWVTSVTSVFTSLSAAAMASTDAAAALAHSIHNLRSSFWSQIPHLHLPPSAPSNASATHCICEVAFFTNYSLSLFAFRLHVLLCFFPALPWPNKTKEERHELSSVRRSFNTLFGFFRVYVYPKLNISWAERVIGVTTDEQTGRQTVRQTGRQRNRLWDRQKNWLTNRWRGA